MRAPFARRRREIRLLRVPAGGRARFRLQNGRGRDTEPVPVDVRLIVWNRDGGRCRNCGSQQELQFDHIIPRSWGGASTVENVQILCARCNRRKGASLVDGGGAG